MKQLKFKTNINCSGCVASVTPLLNTIKGIEEWRVNTAVPDKILELKTNSVDEQEIITALHKAGFNAEPIK